MCRLAVGTPTERIVVSATVFEDVLLSRKNLFLFFKTDATTAITLLSEVALDP